MVQRTVMHFSHLLATWFEEGSIQSIPIQALPRHQGDLICIKKVLEGSKYEGGGGCSLLINKLCFEEQIGILLAAADHLTWTAAAK